MLAVPWQLILKQARVLISAAGDLRIRSRRTSADIITAKDLNALRDRCAELAKDQEAYAELVKQLTDQLDAITDVAQDTVARVRQGAILGASGAALGLTACLVALLR